MTHPLRYDRFRQFVGDLAELLDRDSSEPAVLEQGAVLLQQLVSHDDWLPATAAQPDPQRYQQFLLHADARQRFSVVSFIWGPGQSTPIHDHRVWGLIGMLRGAEYSQGFSRASDGRLLPDGAPIRLGPGQVEAVSPSIGDIHQVSNAFDDRVSISIHVYGANIGAVARAVYSESGEEKPFISGYSNAGIPNFWDLSKESPPKESSPA